MMNRLFFAVLGFAFAFLLCTPAHAATKKVALADLATPLCDDPLKFDKTGVCGLPEGKKASDFVEATCPKDVKGFSFADGKCAFDAKKADAPHCEPSTADLTYDTQTKLCMKVVGQPTSSPGAYVGDCFKVVGVPDGSGLVPDKYYAVTDQSKVPSDD